jgi:hypothetical protein
LATPLPAFGVLRDDLVLRLVAVLVLLDGGEAELLQLRAASLMFLPVSWAR